MQLMLNNSINYLAVASIIRFSASTQNQAHSARPLLYRHVLDLKPGQPRTVIRARKSKWLPVVLTRDEVRAVLNKLHGKQRLIAVLMYGTGMRLMECLRLRVEDIDFGSSEIIIREAKATKIGTSSYQKRSEPHCSNT